MMLKGITVELLCKIQTGIDGFRRPIYTEQAVPVSNVLIAPLSNSEVLETLNLTGRRAVYQLAIPKGDTHDWENQRVRFFGAIWRVIGKPMRGIEELIPGEWNLKVKVEGINDTESQN